MTIPSLASDYTFESGGSTLDGFGKATSTDEAVAPDPITQNTRRNKDAALLPPPYFYGSGEIPTDPSSPYHNNLVESGFVAVDQNLPKTGGEDYKQGTSTVKATTSGGFLPSTSQTETAKTTPLYYNDGSIGTLYVARTGKTIKVYEGEDLSNLAKGAGHFSSTSAWDGNVGLAGHNRGNSPYFSFVKDLKNGDKIVYTTKYGTRTYAVYSVNKVNVNDTSSLSWSGENILTLITCVSNVPEQRFSVQAKEVKQVLEKF
jgi:sortase A